MVRNWFRSVSTRTQRDRRRPAYRLTLEALEERVVPAGEIIDVARTITPFAPRFTANTNGDIAILGNTLETAGTLVSGTTTPLAVANAQNGVSNVNNNSWNMAFVDVDNNPATFNSSQAALTLPP